MKKRHPKKLTLHRETVCQLASNDLQKAAGGKTLTFEGSCDNSLCPCPGDTTAF